MGEGSDPDVPPVSTASIRLPARYRVSRHIANGGMASVWEARDELLGRDVAVKLLGLHLTEDATARMRFEREARAAAGLSGHPNVVTIYDVGEFEGRSFIGMELMRGSVAEVMAAGGAIPVDKALRWLREAGSALDAAHETGIIHRDVKPANMLLDERGRLYLADFGIAKALEGSEGLTRTGVGVGTPEYMAPEQAQGRADPRSDLYALGVVLYQMLTGRVPYSGNSTVEVLMRNMQEPPPLLPLRNVAPALPEARTLRDELATFEVTMTEAANATFSHREGKHDDLVLAVALALWGARQRPSVATSTRYLGQGRGDIPAYGNGVRPYGPRR